MSEDSKSKNIIKVRDDKTPLSFSISDTKDGETIFQLDGGQKVSYPRFDGAPRVV